MPWVKLDDAFHAHPKLAEMGAQTLPAVGLYTLALTWSADYLTDGHIPAGQVRKLGGNPRIAAVLVEAHLWEVAEDGFQIHDYNLYNPTRDKVLADREAEMERKRRGRASQRRPDAVQDLSGRTDDGQVAAVRDLSGKRPAVVRQLSGGPVPVPGPVPVVSGYTSPPDLVTARRSVASGAPGDER